MVMCKAMVSGSMVPVSWSEQAVVTLLFFLCGEWSWVVLWVEVDDLIKWAVNDIKMDWAVTAPRCVNMYLATGLINAYHAY